MKKLMILFFLIYTKFIYAQNSETFNVDWNNDLNASILYGAVLNSLTQNLNRYNYYHVDYGIKNEHNGWWKNEVKYETFTNPYYYRIMLTFNHFYIEYLFTISQLQAGKNSVFAGTPFRRCNSRTFAQDVNEVVDRIYFHMFNFLENNQSNLSKEEQIRLGVDLGWLIGTRGNLKMRIN